MVDVRTPPTVGVVSALVYALATGLLYVSGSIPSGALQTYYSAFGPVGPPYITVLALVAVIVLAAGREGRASLDLVAGVSLVIGFIVMLLTAMWAFDGVGELVGSLSTTALLEYHRWVLLAASAGLFASAAWFADVIGVLRRRPDAAP